MGRNPRLAVALALAPLVLSSPLVLPAAPATAQQQCDQPAFGDALPIDLDLPHDVATGRGVGVTVVDTGASAPGVITERPGDRDHCLLHGTAVAGVLDTVAPDAVVVSVRQGDGDGHTTVADLVEAIERARTGADDHGVRVLNISVVACEDTAELRDAVAAAVHDGLLVVAAAGNTGQCPDGHLAFPASLPDVLAVGGVDARDPATPDAGRRPASYSVPGGWVDLHAPGGPVSGQLEDSDSQVRTVVGDPAPFSGTSFAAPVVAGAAALVWQLRPELSATQVRTLLTDTADPGTVPVVSPTAAVSAAMDGAATGIASYHVPGSVEVQREVDEPRDLRVPVFLAAVVGAALLVAALVRRQPPESV